MDAEVVQPASPKKQMRWACPLGCEGGFINIPQTNEHLKKSHVTPKKGQNQGSITQEEMEEVRAITKRNRLKSDRFKMQQIHQVFNRVTKPEDLELHSATRDEIRRMSTACAQKRPGTEPIIATFKRLATGGEPGFRQISSERQEAAMLEACLLIPYFLRSLSITGILISDDEEGHPTSSDDAKSTSMHPPPTRDASGSSVVQERSSLNTLSQVSSTMFDGSTVVGSVVDQDTWPNEQFGTQEGVQDWQPLATNGLEWPQVTSPQHTDFVASSFASNQFQGPALWAQSPGGTVIRHKGMGFNDNITNGVSGWAPNAPEHVYRGARDVDEDLARDVHHHG